jgi:hypothetical protein
MRDSRKRGAFGGQLGKYLSAERGATLRIASGFYQVTLDVLHEKYR